MQSMQTSKSSRISVVTECHEAGTGSPKKLRHAQANPPQAVTGPLPDKKNCSVDVTYQTILLILSPFAEAYESGTQATHRRKPCSRPCREKSRLKRFNCHPNRPRLKPANQPAMNGRSHAKSNHENAEKEQVESVITQCHRNLRLRPGTHRALSPSLEWHSIIRQK